MRFLPTALLSTIFCGVSTSGASDTPVPETAVFGSICQPNRPRRRDNALRSEISCELLRTEANLPMRSMRIASYLDILHSLAGGQRSWVSCVIYTRGCSQPTLYVSFQLA